MDNSIKSGIFTTICLFFYVIFHFFVLSFDFVKKKVNFFQKTLDRVGATRSMLFVMGNVDVSMLSKKKTKRRLVL